VSYWLLRRTWSRVQSCLALVCWVIAYLLLWAIGLATRGMPVWLYLVAWLVFGALGGLLITRLPAPAPARSPARRRAVIRRSEFGRIPVETVVVLTQEVRQVTALVAQALPAGTPSVQRDWTLRALLDRTVRDWWENENTSGLEQKDSDDLKSFI